MLFVPETDKKKSQLILIIIHVLYILLRYLTETLEKLHTDYINLYIAHMPFGFEPPQNMTLDPSQSGALDW